MFLVYPPGFSTNQRIVFAVTKYDQYYSGEEGEEMPVILEAQAAWNLPRTTACVNCLCSTVTMPIKLSIYVTWNTSEIVAELCVV